MASNTVRDVSHISSTYEGLSRFFVNLMAENTDLFGARAPAVLTENQVREVIQLFRIRDGLAATLSPQETQAFTTSFHKIMNAPGVEDDDGERVRNDLTDVPFLVYDVDNRPDANVALPLGLPLIRYIPPDVLRAAFQRATLLINLIYHLAHTTHTGVPGVHDAYEKLGLSRAGPSVPVEVQDKVLTLLMTPPAGPCILHRHTFSAEEVECIVTAMNTFMGRAPLFIFMYRIRSRTNFAGEFLHSHLLTSPLPSYEIVYRFVLALPAEIRARTIIELHRRLSDDCIANRYRTQSRWFAPIDAEDNQLELAMAGLTMDQLARTRLMTNVSDNIISVNTFLRELAALNTPSGRAAARLTSAYVAAPVAAVAPAEDVRAAAASAIRDAIPALVAQVRAALQPRSGGGASASRGAGDYRYALSFSEALAKLAKLRPSAVQAEYDRRERRDGSATPPEFKDIGSLVLTRFLRSPRGPAVGKNR